MFTVKDFSELNSGAMKIFNGQCTSVQCFSSYLERMAHYLIVFPRKLIGEQLFIRKFSQKLMISDKIQTGVFFRF